MAQKKQSTGKQKLEPSYSPKPVQSARRMLTVFDGTAPSPSPSFSPDPITQSPLRPARKV